MKRRFEVLDILRGVFSSLVVFYHIAFYTKSPILKNNFIGNSFLFVDFFFILSGFVISYTYRNIDSFNDLKVYMKKRFFRLYPLHLVMLLVFLAYEISKHVFKNSAAGAGPLLNVHNNVVDFFSNLFLLNSVKIPGINSLSWNYPSWSISAEMISYLLFGLLAVMAFKFKIRKFDVVIKTVVVAAAVCILYAINHNFYFFETYNYGFLRGILGFFVGSLAFNIYTGIDIPNINISKITCSILEFVIIAIIVLAIVNGKAITTNYGYVFELLFLIAVLIFCLEGGILSQGLLKVNLLKKAGKYSYSIYMTHAIINIIFNLVLIKILKIPASYYSFLFIINYVIVYLSSAWTYQHIEIRYNNYSKGKAINRS